MSFRAKALIGIRIPLVTFNAKVHPKRKVKAFEHDYPENFVFDPISGRKLWDVMSDDVAEFESDGGDDLLCGYPIVYDGNNEVNVYVCAYLAAETGDEGPFDDFNKHAGTDKRPLVEIGRQMGAKLAPLGLWDPSQFGLWAVLVYV